MSNKRTVILFDVPEDDRAFYVEKLVDYYTFYKKLDAAEANIKARVAYEHLIYGRTIEGNTWPDRRTLFFDERLERELSGFYTPESTRRKKYKAIGKKPGKPPKVDALKGVNSGINIGAADEYRVKVMKETLTSEYPFLKNRKDLDDIINNYCVLSVKISILLDGNVIDNNNAIKNLTETMIKLGNHLGISESKKQLEKLADLKDNVASLSTQFEQTCKEYPELVQMMRYKELRILVQKFDRQELSRELFQLPIYAGCLVEEARDYIALHAKEYGDL